MTEVETHPFFHKANDNYKNIPGGFFPEGMKVLIVGTFPPKKNYFNNPHYFFYPSPRSHFWNQIDEIFSKETNFVPLKKTAKKNANETKEDNSERKQFFARQHGLGFIDVFTHVRRKKEGSAKDKDLIPLKDVFSNGLMPSLLDEFPDLERICCMYSLAYNTTRVGLSKEFDLKEIRDDKTANEKKFLVRNIEIVQLFPASRSKQKKDIKQKQYAHFLFDKTL